ncbi:MAG: flagellar filament capping protein FliD [Gemmatimonadales bacterium]|jgi:flagellar hook-associated protein 2|nr:flagellar filament capping protein FliD [Gemmatimonadales bacterium]MBP6571502.1 flagellar filament capping protein FliD [Gemmatimonadales bacterium]MBP9898977.1 flagellar filament capping protein FliD [Gemmatimonadales bacterium]
MTSPLSSISGLISGFNYRDLVDAIIAQARVPADRWEAQSSANTAQTTALNTYRGLLDKVRTAAKTLRTGTAFDAMSTTTSVLSGTRAIASATADATATAGSYQIKVDQLAKAEKLAGTIGRDAATALGAAGTFTVNGQTVTVAATDTLTTLRDSINALNSGATPTGVTATILTVTPGDARLILTSAKSGAAGIALADTLGTTLQTLGFQDINGAELSGSVLVNGADALFRVDDIPLTRTSNVVTDAITGVTLTLTADDVGAVTNVQVDRFLDAARTSMQGFVDAYNGLVAFLKAQGTASTSSTPPLYGQSVIRTARSQLPSLLLEAVGGAAADLATVGQAGLSLTRDGTLTLDSAKFDDAFKNRQGDLRTLFTEQRTATGAGLSFVSSAQTATGGARAIDITAIATKATLSTTGFAGTYDAGGTADGVTVTDTNSGRTTTVALTTGMSTADIVLALQTAFDTDGLNLTATQVGNEIQLDQLNFGLGAGIGLVFTGLGDGAAEAWSADTSAAGTDVAGTIGGFAATGMGQLLVGTSGTDAEGLTVQYTGLTIGAAGSINLSLGAGARIERLLDQFLNTGGGLIDSKVSALDTSNARLATRVSALDARLERRRAVLLANFLQMETAIARLKQQSTSLLGSTGTSNSSS